MLSFEKINNIDFSIINDLIIAVKYTSEKYKIDSHEQLKLTLRKIIVNNDYSCITKAGGMRDKVLKYSKDLIFNLLLNCVFRKNNIKINDYNNNYWIEDIDTLIDYVLVDTLYKKIDNTFVSIQEDNVLLPQNVKYYNSSEKLKILISNGSQTKLKNTSFSFNGMTADSNVGKNRTNQEDSYYIGVHPKNANFKLMVVADGMGGHESGEIASNIAVKELMDWFDKIDAHEFYKKDNSGIGYLLNRKIIEISKKISDVVYNSGTTLCVAIIKNETIIMCNVGDSQGYIFDNGVLRYETSPDNITNNPNIPTDISRFHKNNNMITNFLGNSGGRSINPKISIIEYKLQNNHTYRVILCSDGVVDCISRRNIINIVNQSDNVSKALVEYAISNYSYFKDELDLLDEADKYKANYLYNTGQIHSYIEAGKDNTTAVSTTFKK